MPLNKKRRSGINGKLLCYYILSYHQPEDGHLVIEKRVDEVFQWFSVCNRHLVHLLHLILQSVQDTNNTL